MLTWRVKFHRCRLPYGRTMAKSHYGRESLNLERCFMTGDLPYCQPPATCSPFNRRLSTAARVSTTFAVDGEWFAADCIIRQIAAFFGIEHWIQASLEAPSFAWVGSGWGWFDVILTASNRANVFRPRSPGLIQRQ
jgi:hypothetical protein